jgi:hypothetical protein
MILRRITPGWTDIDEQPFTAAQYDRRDVQEQLVQQSGGQELVDGARAARHVDVLLAGRLPGPRQRRLDAAGDEVERGTAGHRQRRTLVVGEHEHRRVERRLVAPPAAPRGVPLAVAAAEHLPAHDVGADVAAHPRGDVAVGGPLATGLAVLLLPFPRRDRPLVQAFAADAERLRQRLVRPGRVAVHRD